MIMPRILRNITTGGVPITRCLDVVAPPLPPPSRAVLHWGSDSRCQSNDLRCCWPGSTATAASGDGRRQGESSNMRLHFFLFLSWAVVWFLAHICLLPIGPVKPIAPPHVHTNPAAANLLQSPPSAANSWVSVHAPRYTAAAFMEMRGKRGDAVRLTGR